MNSKQLLPTSDPAPWPDLPFPLLNKRWFQHLLFWFSIALISSINWHSYNVHFSTELIYYLLHVTACALVIYINFYFLFPRFLLKKKFAQYALLFFICVVLGTLLRRILIYHIVPMYSPETKHFTWATRPLFDFVYLIHGFTALMSVVTFASMIKLGKMWYQKELLARGLQKEKLEAELRFLKNQINPHFFFNTLNNLYALTLKKSDTAPEVVLGLSALMDYLLHESNVDFMPLNKEINILENYMALEKIRYEENIHLSFHINGDTNNLKVAPLLFLPFVENAFKHGLEEAEEKAWIKVELEVQNGWIIFRAENSKTSRITPQTNSGIGLQNVQKRLDIIYKDRYNLQFFNEEDTFLVVLKIDTKVQKTAEL